MSKKPTLPNEPTDGDVVAATEQFIKENRGLLKRLADNPARKMRFEVYKAEDGWRFRLIAGNGEIILPNEAYKNKRDCKHVISLVQQSQAADVVEVES